MPLVKGPMPVVLDTNVWISAALSPAGAPARVVHRVLSAAQPVFTDATYAEFETRLWKPKFDPWLSPQVRRSILRDARSAGLWVAVPPELAARRFSRDVMDDGFVHAALAAGAPWIVSGDDDLLVLSGLPDGCRVVSPAQALDLDGFPR